MQSNIRKVYMNGKFVPENEAKIFKNARIIDSQKTSWSKLYKIKNSKKY